MTIWDERYQSGEGLRWWPNEELVRFLGKTYGDMRKLPGAGKHALELGCGTGCNLLALTAYGFFAHGVDASDEACLLAQEYVGSMVDGKAQFRVSRLALPDTLHWSTASMDLVVDCQTIQHLSWLDRSDTYKEVARVLKPTGKFWTMCWSGPAKAANSIYGGCYPELDYMLLTDILDVLGENGLQGSFPVIVTRTYPEHGGIQGEWMIVEAVKA